MSNCHNTEPGFVNPPAKEMEELVKLRAGLGSPIKQVWIIVLLSGATFLSLKRLLKNAHLRPYPCLLAGPSSLQHLKVPHFSGEFILSLSKEKPCIWAFLSNL